MRLASSASTAKPSGRIASGRWRDDPLPLKRILMAMLTGLVNIAVFAAFSSCVRCHLLANAEFKPICGPHERDIARYGWQKRQEVATGMAKTARWTAKTARMREVTAASMRPHPGPRLSEIGCLRLYAVVKVLAARDGTAMIELRYYKKGRVARRCSRGCGAWTLDIARTLRYYIHIRYIHVGCI